MNKVIRFLIFGSFCWLLNAEKPVDSKLITHGLASPLSSGTMVQDWPRFNGMGDDAWVPEENIQLQWPVTGPKLIWEVEKGEGYSSPAIKDGILVLFHRFDGHEVIEGREAETGKLIWVHQYKVDYRDRYGYLNGPRASPVISGERVYAHGVTAWLTCLELKTGKLIWKRDLSEEFGIPQNFFGKGSNPLATRSCLIINIGGVDKQSVVGLDLVTGRTKWVTLDDWGASYSSPRKGMINGREVCFVFAGGESRPSTGGLLVIDPSDGNKLSRFPWRSTNYESVNAVPPIPLGENKVFLSECYEKGSVVLSFDEKFEPSKVWQNSDLNIHWMTPVVVGSNLYGIAGRHQRGAQLFCVSHVNGSVFWKESVLWNENINGRNLELALFRGSILRVGKGNHSFIALSELGSLVSLHLNSEGWEIQSSAQLFFSSGTWTLPALSGGLLYVMQNEIDQISGKKPRLLCYDLRN